MIIEIIAPKIKNLGPEPIIPAVKESKAEGLELQYQIILWDSKQIYSTVRYFSISFTVLGPIPLTLVRSMTDLNLPCFSR